MAIYSGFSHEKWWIFPVRYVNVYQRVCQQFAIENGPIEISLMYPFNSMVDLSIVEHGFQLVGVFFPYIGNFRKSQLTNSIIFQRGR